MILAVCGVTPVAILADLAGAQAYHDEAFEAVKEGVGQPGGTIDEGEVGDEFRIEDVDLGAEGDVRGHDAAEVKSPKGSLLPNAVEVGLDVFGAELPEETRGEELSNHEISHA